MSLFVSETTADRMNAAQAVIGDVRQRRTRLGFDLAQSIDQHAFAQGPTAGSQHLDVQRAHGPFLDLSARDNDVRALIADAGKRAPLCYAHFTASIIQPPELSRCNLVTACSRAF